jgi:hypothetical protein
MFNVGRNVGPKTEEKAKRIDEKKTHKSNELKLIANELKLIAIIKKQRIDIK